MTASPPVFAPATFGAECFHLRPVQPEDGPALIVLWQRCGLTRPWNDPAQDIARPEARAKVQP